MKKRIKKGATNGTNQHTIHCVTNWGERQTASQNTAQENKNERERTSAHHHRKRIKTEEHHKEVTAIQHPALCFESMSPGRG